jgi:imidazolonepropionase-like amidohydrolase
MNPFRVGRARVWLAVAVLTPMLGAAGDRAVSRENVPASFAIVHAFLVPMDSDRVLPDQTIVVVGDRIVAVGPDDTTALPDGAAVIDVHGAYVTPGLIDMHVHVRRGELRSYVDAGITSVRNMWGYQALPALMHEIDAGVRVGPAIYSASQGLDGTPAVWPETQIVDDPAQADAIVEAQVAAGWRFLKVYNSLSTASYDAIVAAARARGIRFLGHVPNRVPVEHALDSAQASIEHLRGYDLALTRRGTQTGTFLAWEDIDASRIPALAAHTATAGTWNCPTMAVFDVLTRQVDDDTRASVLANRATMIRALFDAGARLLAGTDSGIDLSVPGASIHDELEDLVGAGLSPYEALRAATSGAAEFLQESDEIGTVTVGRRADLLIVDANPLEDVAALRSVEAVVLRGAWFPAGGRRSPLVLRIPAERGGRRGITRPSP